MFCLWFSIFPATGAYAASCHRGSLNGHPVRSLLYALQNTKKLLISSTVAKTNRALSLLIVGDSAFLFVSNKLCDFFVFWLCYYIFFIVTVFGCVIFICQFCKVYLGTGLTVLLWLVQAHLLV